MTLLDFVLEAAYIGTFRRTALWSSVTAAGAPLGFHLLFSQRNR
jgi:hypothetical protein